jgi:hypothetical protein
MALVAFILLECGSNIRAGGNYLVVADDGDACGFYHILEGVD